MIISRHAKRVRIGDKVYLMTRTQRIVTFSESYQRMIRDKKMFRLLDTIEDEGQCLIEETEVSFCGFPILVRSPELQAAAFRFAGVLPEDQQ